MGLACMAPKTLLPAVTFLMLQFCMVGLHDPSPLRVPVYLPQSILGAANQL